jgi:hypothetical protein
MSPGTQNGCLPAALFPEGINISANTEILMHLLAIVKLSSGEFSGLVV